ncbi:MAG: beta galactosidase jelly roll domain-containing protein, partial [Armatimonadetes bacterium]|nr:beta galactosidase jelly roll domain-containing protein [Armatimonadota bacterium]
FHDRCAHLLDEARKLAAAEPYQSRVAAFRGHFDRMDAYEKARASMARGDYSEAAKWGDEMVKCVQRVNNSMLLQEAGPWGGAMSGASVAAFARRINSWIGGAKGRLVAMLPSAASFRVDPEGEGIVGRWYLPNANIRGWKNLHMTTAWHNRRIVTAEGRRYSGVAWYRVKLGLPQTPEGKVRVCFPEVKGTGVWTWCNGTYAGMAEDSGENTLTVNVAGLLHAGDNLVVFRLQGEGGLSLPPFLFAPGTSTAFAENIQDLSVFPSEWRFRLDPEGVGAQQAWYKPDFSGPGWRNLPVTTYWDDSIGQYSGEGWYRVSFRIPSEVKGKQMILRFGAVDEEAWVYLNGEMIGEHTTASTGQTIHQIWDKPFDVSVRNARPGEDNLLAVRVRNAAAAGGIFRPVRLLLMND